jgi:ribulose-5-phosphate 4-epimerase/fuculose-1-phosphate aldolase
MSASENETSPGSPHAGISDAEWQVRVDLAACYRLVAHHGWTDLIYTHISARVPGTDHYLLNPFGWGFDEITASSLVKIDLDGNKLDDNDHDIHRAGFVIHSAIHAHRPDAHCVLHLHTRAGMAISMLKCGLLPLSQHAMMFHGKVAYHESEGFALDLKERERLANDLGNHRILILRNHGSLVVGQTVPETFSMMWHFEKACQAQLDAMACGVELNHPPAGIAEEISRLGFNKASSLAEYAGRRSPLGWKEWPAMRRLLDRVSPGYDL